MSSSSVSPNKESLKMTSPDQKAAHEESPSVAPFDEGKSIKPLPFPPNDTRLKQDVHVNNVDVERFGAEKPPTTPRSCGPIDVDTGEPIVILGRPEGGKAVGGTEVSAPTLSSVEKFDHFFPHPTPTFDSSDESNYFEDEHGTSITSKDVDNKHNSSGSDSSRVKSWAKLIAVFVLGGILGGVIVGLTPIASQDKDIPDPISLSPTKAPAYSELSPIFQDESSSKDDRDETQHLGILNDSFEQIQQEYDEGLVEDTTEPAPSSPIEQEDSPSKGGGETGDTTPSDDDESEDFTFVPDDILEDLGDEYNGDAVPVDATTEESDDELTLGEVVDKVVEVISSTKGEPDNTVPDDDVDEMVNIILDNEDKVPRDEHAKGKDTTATENVDLTLEDDPAEDDLASTTSTSTTAPEPPSQPTDKDDDMTYVPGDLQQMKKGVLLSRGLDVAIIAQSGRPVQFADGTQSSIPFHHNPDFGATFPSHPDDESNPGGYVYVSNSEIQQSAGGVGGITFDKDGRIVGYRMLLTGTSMNCGGGKTPWNSWITCEEKTGDRSGQIYQVDPFGPTLGARGGRPRKTKLGGDGGAFESFAYDVRNKAKPRFFVTEDDIKGSLRRFTPSPSSIDWEGDPSEMLHGDGKIEYLLLDPKQGKYEWTTNKSKADMNAKRHYQNCEGIDVRDDKLYFVSKAQNEMFILDLDGRRNYKVESTKGGTFSGSPDQLVRLVGDSELLYYTEEGGNDAGVHARDFLGRYFTILESPVYMEETTGLAFSPDHKHLYVAYQKNGILLDVWRKDGGSFSGNQLNIKYHNTESGIE